ncbi:peroxisomal membrane protein-domain-containing protein [Dunaliella salina]|uniref:Peroxisomal membrane protein PEX16 n=1 Tax=Dunaliella salina TaxID=3046 RepID=A0ABQ7H6F7_DUNSA|nr:peroxisomal membrane protein-domain-containing protein [Dunaliella salina]|eukprot:KAF5842396.1 peroxisomal membrane protein-domain-containing protein [Dunaliella salina]
MGRYAPLVAMESVKSFLKMLMWSQYSGHLYLRHPAPEDIAHFEAEQGFQDVLSALERLRERYTSLSDCSAAATNDIMGHLSAAVQPLHSAVQPLLRWLSFRRQTKPDQLKRVPGTRKGTSCGSADAGPASPSHSALCPGNISLGQMDSSSGFVGSSNADQHVLGAGHRSSSGGRMAIPDGLSVHWSQAPELDGRGSMLGNQEPEVLPWQSGYCMGSSSREQQLSLDGGKGWGEAQTSGTQGALSSKGASPRRMQGASSAAGMRVGGVDAGNKGVGERPQGPGLPLHVFCDERAGMNLIWLGEMLHIWRPVIYSWMLYRYGRRSWRPWWASLAVDLLSRHFSRRGRLLLQGSAGKAPGPQGTSAVSASKQQHAPTSLLSVALVRGLSVHQWSAGEERELGERRRKLAMYLLRSPFYNQFVKPPAESLQRRTAHMPVIGSCTDYVAGLLDTFTKYYTYTSSSS